MFKRNELRRAVLAAVTAALLCGAPAQAAGWEAGAPAFFERAWAWITGWLSPDGGPQEKDGGVPRSYQEQGVGSGPKDGPSSATSGSPVCQGDAGVCIDPNG